MRANFKLGAPLDFNGTRYKDKTDRKEEQEDIVEKWIGSFSDLANNYLAESYSEEEKADKIDGFELYI